MPISSGKRMVPIRGQRGLFSPRRQALMLTSSNRVLCCALPVCEEVAICFIASDFSIRIWFNITACWLHGSISAQRCVQEESPKVKMCKQISWTSQAVRCDVGNLNGKGHSKQTVHGSVKILHLYIYIYIYLWLIHVEVWQNTKQFCKAIILQLKK